ncbi:protein SRC2 [Ziziphus jujuba]|uniref:Protein SRC2 n=2 Tax=Ziziphus jujuba TaxID=326968 RepID=A0A6P4A1X4_ZIZJJ|nr:protein SRC2 [Ziziphus jujuba]KAH7538082.1 hypothetical protein FEM48_Zijuj03G0161400 [Ziziphus jujuba var. spinosa]
MASRHEVEVKLSSAKDLKNVNWRHGPLRPYAVLWVDPNNKCSSRVDQNGDTCPTWDETIVIPLPGPVDDKTTLFIDVVHAGSEPDTKPLIGSAQLRLRDVLEEVGIGEKSSRSLKLKRPSGRPQGKLEVNVTIRDPYHRAPDAYYAPPPYGVPPPGAQPSYGAPYGGAARDPYYAAGPPSGYPAYNAYNAPPNPYGYGQAGYGQVSYGEPVYVEEKKKSKFGGMGTGLAVGAAAGVLGGVALAEGADYVEDKIDDEVEERVDEDLGFDE